MKKSWKGMWGVAALVLFAGNGVTAQQAATPTAEQLVANYVRAAGGRVAMERIKSRVMKGTIDAGTGTLFPFESRQKAPNKRLAMTDVPGQGQTKEGFDGTIGWSSAPDTGVQELSGMALAAMNRNSQFYRWLHMKEIFAKLEAAGTDKVGDRDAYVMVATPAEGFPEKFYFDTATGLLSKWEYQLETPSGVVTFETFYEDYRIVDGLKLAFTLRQSNPESVLLLRFTEIRHNVPLDDAQFAKPSAP